MFYLVDQPHQKLRFFSRSRMYGDVNWSNFAEVISAFRTRIDDWYLSPAKNLATDIHFSFSLMALNCLLIDTLSQFVNGVPSSSARVFIDFVRRELPPVYRATIPTIRHDDGKRGERPLNDVPEVMYYGFRCGILHQAHTMPYAGIVPDASPSVEVFPAGPLRYSDSGLQCPFVVIAPIALHRDLLDYFEKYMGELGNRHPSHDGRRDNFKRKFSKSFGVDISSAAFA